MKKLFSAQESQINFFLRRIILILKKDRELKKNFLNRDLPLVFLAPPSFMRQLKKTFLGKNKEADVLSFAWPSNFFYKGSKKIPLGEIYLNKKLINRCHKIKFLLVHAVLHLLGFNHYKKNDKIKMVKKEKEILRRI